MTSTISEQVQVLLAARSASVERGSPPSPFALEQARLDEAGVPSGVVSPGFQLPDAAVIDARGNETTLYAVLDHRVSVLVFYRGGWCPYCNIALRTYQAELLPELDRRGVAFVAFTPQVPDETLTTVEKNALTFPVLTDQANHLADQLGIVTQPSDAARAAQLARGTDIAAGNADLTPRIPMPSALIVDSSYVLRWIDVHPNYTTRSEASEILDALGVVE